ncbi:MAG: HNH endonuclease signature motif containing protein [Acidimicrobiia bacterium]
MPATECDLDHIHPWALGGPTSTRNLAPDCRHDHRLQGKGWTVKRIRPGIYRWFSPLGHIYTVRARAP